MGGPGAGVLLCQPLTDQQLDNLDAWLRRVAIGVEGTRPDWDPWHTLAEIHEFVQTIPGTVHEIYYKVNPARQWVFHLVDTVFLKNWLKHPHFHMIK